MVLDIVRLILHMKKKKSKVVYRCTTRNSKHTCSSSLHTCIVNNEMEFKLNKPHNHHPPLFDVNVVLSMIDLKKVFR